MVISCVDNLIITTSSGKEEERKEALITITKSKDIKDLE